MSKKITLGDIAANLGLSQSAVSRALSDKYGVNEKTKALILYEAERLGYQRDKKKSPPHISSPVIAVYVPRVCLTDTDFFVNVISGIESAINKLNLKMILSLTDHYDEHGAEIPFSSVPTPEETQGILIVSDLSQLKLKQLKETGIPMVFLDFISPDDKMNHILVNNYFGMYTATQYIIEKGHRRLIYVGYSGYSYSFTQRYYGCRDCVNRYASLPVECQYVISQPHSQITFNESQLRIAIKSEAHATAILCANDHTAFEVYAILSEYGLKIPDDKIGRAHV